MMDMGFGIGCASDYERGSDKNGYRSAYMCPVCNKKNKEAFGHGKMVTCCKCGVSFITYGNALRLFLETALLKKEPFRSKAITLVQQGLEDWAKRGFFNPDEEVRYDRMRRRFFTAITQSKGKQPIDITELASELDKRAVENAAQEYAELKRRLQTATKELARIKAKDVPQEKSDEALLRFSFVMEED